jgi:hypothetical protein
MIHTKYNRIAKNLCSSGGHHSWLSRDYEDIDCQAEGCLLNKNKKCTVPSVCKIGADGRCAGFVAKPMPTIKQGD